MHRVVTAIALTGIMASTASCGGRHSTVVPAAALVVEDGRVLVIDTITDSVSQTRSLFSRDPDRTLSTRHRIREIVFDQDMAPRLEDFGGKVRIHAAEPGMLSTPKIWAKGPDLDIWEFETLQAELLRLAPDLCRDGSWRESVVAPAQSVFYLCPDGGLYRFDDASGRHTRIDLASVDWGVPTEGGMWPVDRILARPGVQEVAIESGDRVFVSDGTDGRLRAWSVPSTLSAPAGAATPLVDYMRDRQVYISGERFPEALVVTGGASGEQTISLADVLGAGAKSLPKARVLGRPEGVFWFLPLADDPDGSEFVFMHLPSQRVFRLPMPSTSRD